MRRLSARSSSRQGYGMRADADTDTELDVFIEALSSEELNGYAVSAAFGGCDRNLVSIPLAQDGSTDVSLSAWSERSAQAW